MSWVSPRSANNPTGRSRESPWHLAPSGAVAAASADNRSRVLAVLVLVTALTWVANSALTPGSAAGDTGGSEDSAAASSPEPEERATPGLLDPLLPGEEEGEEPPADEQPVPKPVPAPPQPAPPAPKPEEKPEAEQGPAAQAAAQDEPGAVQPPRRTRGSSSGPMLRSGEAPGDGPGGEVPLPHVASPGVAVAPPAGGGSGADSDLPIAAPPGTALATLGEERPMPSLAILSLLAVLLAWNDLRQRRRLRRVV